MEYIEETACNNKEHFPLTFTKAMKILELGLDDIVIQPEWSCAPDTVIYRVRQTYAVFYKINSWNGRGNKKAITLHPELLRTKYRAIPTEQWENIRDNNLIEHGNGHVKVNIDKKELNRLIRRGKKFYKE